MSKIINWSENRKQHNPIATIGFEGKKIHKKIKPTRGFGNYCNGLPRYEIGEGCYLYKKLIDLNN